ncbi:MAG: hypothetical protein JJU34_01675 [Lunatimonas sp.]|uniref:hypothetical protein n=1 Tax=Lunatimonas sp. TaxID=2060141 RepID=UPI00263B76E4|nr:hypothetical protein [Lunatimonas sp.]MCC5935967.1 hypothetical protein [Lunatimonas sp.]
MTTVKTFFALILVILLGVSGYLLVRTDFFSSKVDPYRMIPANSILVFETAEPVQAWNELVSQPLWQDLVEIPALKNLESQLVRLDSLAGRSGVLERTWRGQKFLVSLHPIGREEFDFLFAIAYDGDRVPELIALLESHIEGDTGPKSRNYSGVTLWEYQPELATRTLTYGFYGDVLVASFTSFLVEDAIRTAKSGDRADFMAAYPGLFEEPTLPGGRGRLRIGSQGLGALLGGTTSQAGSMFSQDLGGLPYAAILEPGYGEGRFSLSGKLVDFRSEGLRLQQVSQPLGSEFFHFVSNRSAVVRVLERENLQQRSLPATRLDRVKSTVFSDVQRAFSESSFFTDTAPWLIYLIMEHGGTENPDRVLLVPTVDAQQAWASIADFVHDVDQGDAGVVERDTHLGREIYTIHTEQFPLHLYNGAFDGFSRTYIAQSDGFLIMTNSLRGMKNYLDDLYNDNTWGKSISKRAFIEKFKGDVPFTQWLDVPKFYGRLLGATTPGWSSLFQKYAPNFNTLSIVTLEMNNASSSGSVQLHVDYGNTIKSTAPQPILTLSRSVNVNFPLVFGPRALRNFNDRSLEYLVQDERRTIYLIGPEGNLVFSRELENPIIGEVFQIDYFKNEKLQFVFACVDGIYAFDRLGNLLPEYPIQLPGNARIAHLNLVDYDGNREYRFFVADEMGDLYLLDKQGNLLEGWDPKRTTGRLAEMPAHHRVPGLGDVMISLHENGNLELFTRRGESRAGQPIRLGDGVSTAYGLTDRGGTASQVVTVNDAGEVVSVNFNGELTYRSQLLRPDRETRFHVVNNQNRDDFLIVLHEFNKVSVLNANESPLFDYSILSDDLLFQWFSFGYEKEVFVIVDRVQEFVYLFDLKGNLLSKNPIEGRGRISVSYSATKSEYVIASVYNNQLREYKLPL